MGYQSSKDPPRPVIVKDYNGHYRMDQVDLDDCRRLEDLRAENDRLRKRIRELEQACDNLNEANCKISQELNETKWKLIKAQQRIEELEHIEIDWEVIREDDGEENDRRYGEDGRPRS